MKTIFYFLLLFLLLFLLIRCKTIEYVPVESKSIEYRDVFHRDSIHLYDSIFMKVKGDTVWLEKYKYLYRDKIIRDSIFKTDTIAVPYPITIEKKVNDLKSWQKFFIYIGIVSCIMSLIVIYRKFKK